MSHELRTPLNAIIGFAELLHDGAVDPRTPQHREFLGDILSSGRHLLQLINDVLDLAKVEAGKLEFRPEAVRLDRLVHEVAAVLKTVAANKRLHLELEVDPTCVDAFLDPARFKQVAYNYLSNALKFTSEGGRVVLRIGPEGEERLRLAVTDTGIGVAPDQLHLLFVEFQQLEGGAAKRHQGTGLGLALTKRLVEAQSGSVGVTSVLGEGSTFHAILPRRIETLIEPPRAHEVVGSSQPTILVVEDDARDRAQLVNALANAGYAVETASTGQEALARWRSRKFAAATIDLLLPDMTGVELLQALGREGAGTVGTPLIIVTVIPDARVVAGFGVHEVLVKPLDQEHLIASLVRAGVASTGVPDGG
jgi:CheY-like chemotaxis protein